MGRFVSASRGGPRGPRLSSSPAASLASRNTASRRQGLSQGRIVRSGEGVWSAYPPELLERTLCTTNMIENVVGRMRDTSGRVRRWKGGSMIVRWLASGLLEAARGFRRLKGHDGMKKLLVALRSRDTRIDAPVDTIVSSV